MRRGTIGNLSFLLFATVVVVGSAQEEEFSQKPKKVVKTDQEWAKKLTRNQFLVTRMKATEPAFSGKLLNNHAKGVYTCVCCDSDLFASPTKFNSGTGWPSFWRPYSVKSVVTEMDYHGDEPRVEVMCSTCGAHLGHVFSDGPPPTGLRYCINSLSLKFVKETKHSSSTDKSKSASEDSKKDDGSGETTKPEKEKSARNSKTSAKSKE